MGHRGEDETPEFFREILTRLDLSPDEVLFFDDEMENIEAASEVGIEARFWRGFEDFTSLLFELGIGD